MSLAYVLLGIISIKYATMSSGIAIAWLPNALLLSFFLIKDIKVWKYYIPFFIIAELVAGYSSFATIQSLQFAFINILETTFAAFFIKKFSGNYKTNFSSIRYVIVFFVIGIIIIPTFAGAFGALVYSTQIDFEAEFLELWRIWYFGDAVGILLITPFVIILRENYKSLKANIFNIEYLLIFILSIGLAIEIFSSTNLNLILPTTPLIFILILLWIVYKQGLLSGLILSLLISFISIYYTIQGLGPFPVFEDVETTIYLQEYIALFVIITIFFGTLLKEINNSKVELEDLNMTLEKKVEEKIKSLQEANEKLTLLASKDSLTNIYNRRSLDEFLLQETTKAKRYKNDLSLIILDIDHFKQTNDEFGHQVGDEVLIEMTKIISNNIRNSDVFGRWGGEEFLLLLPQTKKENGYDVAENIRKKIEYHKFKEVGKKTISLGVSTFNHKEDVFTFIKRADTAMYNAKKNGRNRVEF